MGFATREAAAKQAPQSDEDFVRDTLRTTTTQSAAVRATFAQQQELGIPVGVAITDESMNQLMQTLRQINDRMRSYNNGQDLITLPTSTELVDEARLTELQRQASFALGRPLTADSNARLVAAIPGETEQPTSRPRTITDLGPAPPQPVQPPISQPTPVPVTTVLPPTVTTAPPPVAAAPVTGLSEEENQRYQAVLDNLAKIRDAPLATSEAPGPTRHQQRQATQLYDDIKPLIEKLQNGETLTRRQRTKFDRWLGQAEGPDGLIASALPSVNEGEAARRRNEVGVAPSDPRQARIDAISALLGDRQDDVAAAIRNSYADIWLLAEVSSNRMLDLLEQAAQSAVPEAAQELISQADRLYDEQQQAYARMAEIARDRANAAAAFLGTTDTRGHRPLPTGEELSSRNPEYYRESPSLRGVHNGVEDLERTMGQRSQDAGQYLTEHGAEEGRRGSLSFNYVFDLSQAVAAETDILSTLVGLWQYAGDHMDLASPDAEMLWNAYSISAMQLVDPTYNPYVSDYPADVRNALVRRHLRETTGVLPTAEEASPQEVESLMTLLMRNRQFRYDDIVRRVYQEVYILAPSVADPATSAAIDQIAGLRAERALCDINYYPYTRPAGLLINTLTGEPLTFEDGTPMELTSPQRLTMASGFLDRALSAAGARLSADDPILVEARKWQEWLASNAGSVPSERIPVVADAVYQMAVGIMAITEAELWLSDDASGLRVTAGEDVLGKAREAVRFARTLYLEDFTIPEVNGERYYLGATYHPNQSRQWADLAIRSLAPATFAVTDALATDQLIFRHDTALGADPVAGATEDEKMAEGRAAERSQLDLLVSLRDVPSFTSSSVPTWQEWSAPYHTLNPAVGRVPSLPLEPGVVRRTSDTPLDTHVSPGDNSDSSFIDLQHDDSLSYRWGLLPQEVERQRILRGDDSAPVLIRAPESVNMAEATGAQAAVSDAYATESAQDITREANQALLGVLDSKMAYVSQLFSSTRVELAQELQLVDGSLGTTTADVPANAEMIGILQNPPADRTPEMVEADRTLAVSEFARSIGIDPRAFLIVRALEAFTLLSGNPNAQPPVPSLRDQLAERIERGEDVSTELRLAIAIAERALGDLSAIGTPYGALAEGGIGHILPPPTETQEFAVTVTYEDEPRRNEDTGQRYWRAIATVTPDPGPEVTLLYYWTFYEPTEDGTLLLRSSSAAVARGEPEYVGMVVPNATLPDGSVGAAVVRIRPTEAVTRRGADVEVMGATEEGMPEIDVGGRPAEVLFYLKDATTLDAVRDELFTRRSREGLLDFSDQPIQPVPYRVGRPEARAFVEPLER